MCDKWPNILPLPIQVQYGICTINGPISHPYLYRCNMVGTISSPISHPYLYKCNMVGTISSPISHPYLYRCNMVGTISSPISHPYLYKCNIVSAYDECIITIAQYITLSHTSTIWYHKMANDERTIIMLHYLTLKCTYACLL